MNIYQNLIGTIFPSYKRNLIRQEENNFFSAIVDALPESLADIKLSSKSGKLLGLNNWELYKGFKFATASLSEKALLENKKRGQNFKISGISVFSKQNNNFVDVELLVKDNFVSAIKTSNDNFQISAFDITKINVEKVTKIPFEFPPDDIDIFYNSLDKDIQERLNLNEIFDIDFNGKTYYVFYDLEDGNYLAVDKNQKVYSLVHDAKPMAKTMKCNFNEILNEISENKFNKEKHLDERYSK